MSVREVLGRIPNSFVKQGIKHAAGFFPLRLRFGKVFWSTYSFLQESQWWSRDRLIDYQALLLNKLLTHAYENVTYYRRVFDERNLKPGDIKSPADLPKLPYLTKEIIRDHFEDLRARNIPSNRVRLVSTSGSTGNPLLFLSEKEVDEVERAFITRVFNSHNSRLFLEKSTWVRSYVPKEKEPIYRFEPHLKMMFLSAYHLSPKTIREYKRLIETYQGRTLVGYPSSLYILAFLAEQEGLKINTGDIAHSGSETLLDEWKEKIEKVFRISVKDHYGLAEKVALFHLCGKSNLYHENLEYAVVELADREQDTGEVVGTCLWNYAMPLIRYRTGDRVRIHQGHQSCECGSGLPLLVAKIEGRTDDIIVTPENRYIPAVNFYTLLYKIPGIKMFKIIQHARDEIEVQIVPSLLFTQQNELILLEGFRQRVGQEVNVHIKQVEEIKREQRTGKIRCIESRVR